MRRSVLPLSMFLLVAVLLVGCGGAVSKPGQAQNLTVEMGALAFEPTQIQLPKGQPAVLTIVNKAPVLHDWTIDEIAVENKKEESAGHHQMSEMKEPDLHVSVAANQTATLTFTPKESGTYTYYCTVPGHLQAGMKGSLRVL